MKVSGARVKFGERRGGEFIRNRCCRTSRALRETTVTKLGMFSFYPLSYVISIVKRARNTLPLPLTPVIPISLFEPKSKEMLETAVLERLGEHHCPGDCFLIMIV